MPASRSAPLLRRRVDGVLLLDKPVGLSSNAALQQAKRRFRAEKAGHTGTLDPLASGLLPVCFGEATKFANMLLDALEKLAASRGTAKLIVDASDTARALFEKRGYVAQRRNTVIRGDEWLANTTLEKQLAKAGE